MTGKTVESIAASVPPLCPVNLFFICEPFRPLADRMSLLCFPTFLPCCFERFSCSSARSLKIILRILNNSDGAFSKIFRLTLLSLDASFPKMYLCCLSNLACFTDKRLETIPTNLLALSTLLGVLGQSLIQ